MLLNMWANWRLYETKKEGLFFKECISLLTLINIIRCQFNIPFRHRNALHIFLVCFLHFLYYPYPNRRHFPNPFPYVRFEIQKKPHVFHRRNTHDLTHIFIYRVCLCVYARARVSFDISLCSVLPSSFGVYQSSLARLCGTLSKVLISSLLD